MTDYMGHVQDNAELAVRDMLREAAERLASRFGTVPGDPSKVALAAEDKMDDGSVVRLTLTLDRTEGGAVFDFTGTGGEVLGNWNAPPAVTCAAVIYCVRCLVNQEIPLNQGCLKPIEIIIPEGSQVAPGDGTVVGATCHLPARHRRLPRRVRGVRQLAGVHEQPHLRR